MRKGEIGGAAYEIVVGEDVQQGRKKSLRLVRTQADSPRRATEIIYVNHPLKYKGFEFYRDKEGYSPLFVLRDSLGRVLYGAYVPLQSIEQKDGTYLYRSGSAVAPGSFNFPQDPQLPPVFSLQATYYPDKVKKRAGEIFFQARPIVHGKDTEGQEEKELFKGKAALGKTVKAGDFLLSMDEVRYWTSMKVIYRPGSVIIFSSFWIGARRDNPERYPENGKGHREGRKMKNNHELGFEEVAKEHPDFPRIIMRKIDTALRGVTLTGRALERAKEEGALYDVSGDFGLKTPRLVLGGALFRDGTVVLGLEDMYLQFPEKFIRRGSPYTLDTVDGRLWLLDGKEHVEEVFLCLFPITLARRPAGGRRC